MAAAAFLVSPPGEIVVPMTDHPGLAALLDHQRGIVSSAQLRDLGVDRRLVRRREARGWRYLLPGVVSTVPGELGHGQRLVAALLYAGPGSVLASTTAAAWHGVLSAAEDRQVHVLIPASRARATTSFVVVRRTTRMDQRPWSRGPLAVCGRARAVVDAARDAACVEHARAIVIEAVQRRLVRVPDLRHELEAGQRIGSAWVRLALQDAEAGAWSRPEASLLHCLRSSRVLPRVWANPRLVAGSGVRLPRPDGWLDDVGLALQVHSRRHHEIGADWDDTVMQDGVFAEHGVVVVALTPARIAQDPRGVLDRVERAHRAAQGRPRPDVRMILDGPGAP